MRGIVHMGPMPRHAHAVYVCVHACVPQAKQREDYNRFTVLSDTLQYEADA